MKVNKNQTEYVYFVVLMLKKNINSPAYINEDG